MMVILHETTTTSSLIPVKNQILRLRMLLLTIILLIFFNFVKMSEIREIIVGLVILGFFGALFIQIYINNYWFVPIIWFWNHWKSLLCLLQIKIRAVFLIKFFKNFSRILSLSTLKLKLVSDFDIWRLFLTIL